MYSHILVALDGSQRSQWAGQAVMELARATGAKVTACHVYGVEIHRTRFIEMEPGLPAQYQDKQTLDDLQSAHDQLMNEGFRALSAGYLEDFAAACRQADIPIEAATIQGRSYVGLLHLAQTYKPDLIVMGIDGIGAIGDGILGGTTSRVLYNAPCDLLLVRRPPINGPIVTGVDGSDPSLAAVAKAASLAKLTKKTVRLVAAYDPEFHTRAFNVMAHSLSPQRQQQVGLAKQEKLHNDIIDEGLKTLYAKFLGDAENRVGGNGITVTTSLVTGRAYAALNAQAREDSAEMIVVGRFGHHRQPVSRLGSNAENLVRLTSANVLLVGGVQDAVEHTPPVGHTVETTDPASMQWEDAAVAKLERVPSFVRHIAKAAVENAVRKAGNTRIFAADFDAVAGQFGMGKGRPS